ncbi:MAG: MarR family transcriptional regulator [Chloroflexi bacterium]|nr:MAG: MarR family transcriptional regulator [Chloroflexota bacterium]
MPEMSSLDLGLEASPGYLLARLGAESRRRWSQGLATLGLRTAHFGMLMTLAAVGSASQRQLGRAIGVDPRNLVLLIDQLEERGLVERAADLGDRRRHAVRLTPAGEAALGERTSCWRRSTNASESACRGCCSSCCRLPAALGNPFEAVAPGRLISDTGAGS